MKKYPYLLCVSLAGALAMPLPAGAEAAHHPEQASPPATAREKTPAPEQALKKMQGNVKKMQTQLDRLGKARNETEFQKILGEHRQTMRENMMLGQGMAGMDCAMMGPGMHGMMENAGDGHETMMQRMQAMEKRMDRMQGMMEQMAPPATAR